MAGQLVAMRVSLATGVVGVGLLLCGFGSSGAGVAWTSYKYPSNNGLLSGICLIVPGVLGIYVWAKRNKTVMFGFLMTCVIATIVSAVQVYIAENERNPPSLTCFSYCTTTCTKLKSHSTSTKQHRDLLISILVFNGIGAAFSLAGSILGCITSCNQCCNQ